MPINYRLPSISLLSGQPHGTCNILHIGSVQCSILTDDVELPNNKRCRDLRVIMTSDLYLSIHISEIAAKLYCANCILRCFECKNVRQLVSRLRSFLVYV